MHNEQRAAYTIGHVEWSLRAQKKKNIVLVQTTTTTITTITIAESKQYGQKHEFNAKQCGGGDGVRCKYSRTALQKVKIKRDS